MDVFALCDVVRQTSFDIHCYHKSGHLEKVYENALAHRLRKLGYEVRQQVPIPVYDEDGTQIGDFYADLVVEEILIVELKAVALLINEHTAQLLGYLKGSHIEHGLLINFGAQKLEFRKFVYNQAR